jgi:quercetin dioxygenase-like cupin family protein
MRRFLLLGLVIAGLNCISLISQTTTIIGDKNTPLRPVAGDGNIGIRNAALLDQAEARVIRVVVEAGGTRAMHQHNDVQFHLFVPISGSVELNLADGKSVEVQPWQPYLMKRGTTHGFHNKSSSPAEIMEVFIK